MHSFNATIYLLMTHSNEEIAMECLKSYEVNSQRQNNQIYVNNLSRLCHESMGQ